MYFDQIKVNNLLVIEVVTRNYFIIILASVNLILISYLLTFNQGSSHTLKLQP